MPSVKSFSPQRHSPYPLGKSHPTTVEAAGDSAILTEVQTVSDVLKAGASGPLQGTFAAPGDKSVSHRALILGALATGETPIQGLLESDDVMATARAMAALGASLDRTDAGWRVCGVGVGGFRTPDTVLDFGNSGTGARLTMGAVATTPISAVFSGDTSLSRRPMARVLDPLTEMGCSWTGTRGPYLPLTLHGTDLAAPFTYRLPVPSAQVKSAILLAALNTPGITTVIEPEATRDHTERMLRLFGVDIAMGDADAGGREIAVTGYAEIAGLPLTVPGDPSSAAFPAVAALLVPDSEIVICNVMINPLRIGLYDTLREMGADIVFVNERQSCGEPVADLKVRACELVGVEVPAERAPSMIDEYPILAVAAACAQGRTTMHGLQELRVKESDRLNAIVRGLDRCGIAVQATEDTLTVTGSGPAGVRGQARIESFHDHRIAMAFLTLGLAARGPITVDGGRMIATSFPTYVATMRSLGARIDSGEPA